MALALALVARASGSQYETLLDAVQEQAAGLCAHTREPHDGKVQIDHSVEIETLNDIALHAFRGTPVTLRKEAAAVLSMLVNSRVNLRALSIEAHKHKSTLWKRLRKALAAALKHGAPIPTMAAQNAHRASQMTDSAVRVVASDHRLLAAAIETAAVGELTGGLRYTASVLRALVADEFSGLWSRTGRSAPMGSGVGRKRTA